MNEERAAKHARIVAWLDSRGLDGVVLTRRCTFSWYTCGAHNHVAEACDIGVSSLVVTRDGARAVSNNIEATRLKGEALDEDIDVVEHAWTDAPGRAAAFAETMGDGRFAADSPVGGLDLEPTDDEFDRLRWSMTPWEIERYRELARDVAESVEQTARHILPRTTEIHAAGLLSAALRAKGCTPWVLLVGADDRISEHRHPLPTDAAAERYLMLVTVSERSGLQAACTRIVSFEGVEAHLARRHRAVATVDAALILATRPGATLGDCFAAAQAAYEQTGFGDQWQLHHQGGSIGYLPRELKAEPGSDVPVLADQAFAWNPSITGTKCEDTILCREDGCEIMTSTGRWPAIEVEWNGRVLQRPDILSL